MVTLDNKGHRFFVRPDLTKWNRGDSVHVEDRVKFTSLQEGNKRVAMYGDRSSKFRTRDGDREASRGWQRTTLVI